MTDQPDDQTEQVIPGEEHAIVPPEVAGGAAAEASRTALGIAWWLRGTVAVFWIALLGIIGSIWRGSNGLFFLSGYLMLGTLVISVVLYLSVMLEPVPFTTKIVKRWLAISFADLLVLTAIGMLIALYGGKPRAPGMFSVVAISLGFITGAIWVLSYSFRSNKRYFFLLAILLLLLANLVLLLLLGNLVPWK